MAEQTAIQWCDSSLNLMAGCDGCELWNPRAGVRHCYAGAMTERYKGRPGWPDSFDKPQLFLHRLDAALRWPDLTGKNRPGKPWLNRLPRLVFLNDMGDTFTESLNIDWLTPLLPRLASSPHVWIVLTKRPRRMLEWVRSCLVPRNVWLCVSITGLVSLARLDPFRQLCNLLPHHVLGLSIEPLLQDILPVISANYATAARLAKWVKIGGESHQNQAPARHCPVQWIDSLLRFFRSNAAVFVKQLGSAPTANGERLNLRDSHGGDWNEWPPDLRVREIPAAIH